MPRYMLSVRRIMCTVLAAASLAGLAVAPVASASKNKGSGAACESKPASDSC